MIGFLSFLVVAVWLFSEARMLIKYRDWETTDAFNRTPQEEKSLVAAQREASVASRNLATAEKKIRAAIQRGSASSLRKNNTGEYDNRSALGKKLNKEIRQNRALELRYQNDFITAEKTADELLRVPYKRAVPWMHCEAYRLASRIVIIGVTCHVVISMVFSIGSGSTLFSLITVGLWGFAFSLLNGFYRKQLATSLGF